MRNFINIIKECPLFQGIKEEELSAILGCLGARRLFFDKGRYIFSEGDPAKQIGIVLSGSVQVSRDDYYGNRTLMSRLEPGDLFGESFAFAGVETLPVSVTASAACDVMLIDSSRIISPCSNACGFHTKLIFNLLQIMARKNLGFHQKIEITSKRTTREKLMAYLLAQAKMHQSDSFEIPFDRQTLADYLEVDRSGLSAEISKLRKEGVLECYRNKFTLR
ncbi:MAG: Crp/Fnr family transcriptional regulator [Firmicutes bacterium]|nr:Crp/Fnr family transcriptional regulator [Bacillota bacterium]